MVSGLVPECRSWFCSRIPICGLTLLVICPFILGFLTKVLLLLLLDRRFLLHLTSPLSGLKKLHVSLCWCTCTRLVCWSKLTQWIDAFVELTFTWFWCCGYESSIYGTVCMLSCHPTSPRPFVRYVVSTPMTNTSWVFGRGVHDRSTSDFSRYVLERGTFCE